MLHQGTSLYRSVERVGNIHLGALRQQVKGKKVSVALDEWTDSQGHAIMDVVVFCEETSRVVACLQLTCKGPNLGVEHSEIAAEVTAALSRLGVDFKNVMSFVTDKGAPLKKAFDAILRTTFPKSKRCHVFRMG